MVAMQGFLPSKRRGIIRQVIVVAKGELHIFTQLLQAIW